MSLFSMFVFSQILKMSELRKKRMIFSELDNVKGIGKSRKDKLLKHFGSVRKIKEADPEEISKMPGFSKKIAEDILKALKRN